MNPMPTSRDASRPLPSPPAREGLYDPAFERDSCGVGFVASSAGGKSHAIVEDGLQLLRNLQHRGACGCDQDTGDGAGVLFQMPDAFFRAEADRLGVRLPGPGDYGVAFTFLPRKGTFGLVCRRTLEGIVVEEGQEVLFTWRRVPVDPSVIGWLARSQEPVMEQLLIGRGAATPDAEAFERALYVIRRRAERWEASEAIASDRLEFCIPSCSSRTLI